MLKTIAQSILYSPETPKYKVVTKNENYEERAYESEKWVITTVTGKNYKDATNEGFTRLFKYISGTNKEGQNVPMTSPVLIYVMPGDNEWKHCKEEFQVGFFLSSAADQETQPPTPNDDVITFRTNPAANVYARQFGGFPEEKEFLEQLDKLRTSLGIDHPYIEGICYFCSYDGPMKLVGRRNEVWLLKK